MRIIGGKYRSRVLAEFKGDEVRPTSDRAKEALFNILSLKIPLSRVLDLFSGSGALGIECLSRGASKAVFNDKRAESVKLLKTNLQKLGVEQQQVEIYTHDYLICLAQVKGEFDLIFLDPPYKEGFGVLALKEISRRNLLSEKGIVVYERDRAFEGTIDGLEQFDERKYGRTYFTFFRKQQ
jgi:16S rRNA (guanine(966)-N(2))-methyltransferase RsmD